MQYPSYSPTGSLCWVPGILQARTLEWVAISFSNAWKWKVKVKSLSRVWLFVTPWTVARQAPLPWDFQGKNTGVGCHFLLQGIFTIQGLNPHLLHWQVVYLPLSHQGIPPCMLSIAFFFFLHVSHYIKIFKIYTYKRTVDISLSFWI